MSEEAGKLGARILSGVQAELGEQWNSLSDSEKSLVRACAEDAAFLTFRTIAGEDVAKEKAQTDAQLANIKVAGKAVAAKTLWNVVLDILSTAATVIGTGAVK